METARLLLKAGADANLANRYGVRPLHLAIGNGDVAMVRLLLAARRRPELGGCDRRDLLMMAARVGKSTIVKALLDQRRAGRRRATRRISRRR